MSIFRSPLLLALAGVLAYRTFQGKGRLAGLLGMDKRDADSGAASGDNRSAGRVQPETDSDGIGGWLSRVLGGGALTSGLHDLMDRFRESGHGDTANSWVSTGANQSISPPQLEQALGSDRIAWLMQETGMSREELLSGLSGAVPTAVDALTPEGRMPTADETTRLGYRVEQGAA